jgi:hypothetical protein
MAITDNLIAYWSLGEASGNALDDQGANDLTDTNTVGTAAGKVGNARSFVAANNEYFSLADNADLSTGDIDFTFAAWVNLSSKTDHREILGKWGNPSFEYNLRYLQTTDRFQFLVGSGGDSVSATNLGSPSTSTWYHIVAWYDATANQIGIAVNDGTPNTASFSGGPPDGTSPFWLGQANNRPFDGLIDEVGFWKRVLDSTERTYLYNSGSGRSHADLTGGGNRRRRVLLCGGR